MERHSPCAAFSVAALVDELADIRALPDLDAPHCFAQRQHALDLLAQLDAAPGVILPDMDSFSRRLRSADWCLFEQTAEAISTGVLRGGRLRRFLEGHTSYSSSKASSRLMGRDLADALWAGVCRFASAPMRKRALEDDMVHLEHTPVRVVLALLDRWPETRGANIGLLDVGCGLGQVTHLVAALTDRPVRGFDVDAGYVDHARATAQNLGLTSVTLEACDARDYDYVGNEVVYIFTPFVGEMLNQVLLRIREQRQAGPLVIASYGVSSLVLGKQAWLVSESVGSVDLFRLCLFRRT